MLSNVCTTIAYTFHVVISEITDKKHMKNVEYGDERLRFVKVFNRKSVLLPVAKHDFSPAMQI